MKRKYLALVALLFLASGTNANDLLITGARLLDASGTRLLDGQALLISDGKIAKIAPEDEIDAGADVERLDLTGLIVIPGLIDLHTHLLLHPYDEASWNDQVLKESLELRTIRAVTAAQATLEAGFTTIRDLGTEGAAFADVALRDAIDQDIVPGPHILAVTRALVATGCYGPSGFDQRWSMPIGAEVADGVDGVRVAVRRQISAGADWIKVYADYRRRPGDATTPTYSQEELDAIVAEARSAGIPVAAHATTDDAIRRAVLAGVATIEHGSNAGDDVLRLMKERGVALCPTLAASEAMARYRGWKPGDPDHARIIAAKAMFKRALRSGVTIACGSDAGVFSHGDNAREIELMTQYGMSEAQALRAATTVAAEVLSKGDTWGKVTEGYAADLIALRGNPLRDISALRSPVVVIKTGRIATDNR